MNGLLVADSGPLIALARLRLVALLRACFDDVWVPETVFSEVTGKPSLPDAQVLLSASDEGLLQVVTVTSSDPDLVTRFGLDPGESDAIALALERRARLLIDERRGRAVARVLGLEVLGTLGALLLFREKRLIPALAPHIETLLASGYYLPQALVAQLLRRTGEQ